MDQWLSVLDDLLVRPFPADADVHHVDLRVSEDFEDCQTRDEIYEPRCAEFEADRDRFAQAITNRYGSPQPKDLMPYVSGNPPLDEPGSLLFDYLVGWFCEIDVWQVGDRGIIVEVGHYDKELPLQLMLVVLSGLVQRDVQIFGGCAVEPQNDVIPHAQHLIARHAAPVGQGRGARSCRRPGVQ